jgi:5-methylcytosine-specific restriction endonuclease McrA
MAYVWNRSDQKCETSGRTSPALPDVHRGQTADWRPEALTLHAPLHVPLPPAHAPANPEACPALVLNADYRPLSYYPLSLWNWQDTLKAVFLERVNIVSEYDTVVRSPTAEFRLPSVVSLKTYIQPSRHPAFTRFNVFLRDKFNCQYCGSREELTFDHVVPRSKGGLTSWDNVVAACSSCNLTKGDKLPHVVKMFPLQKPYQPTINDLHRNGRLFPPNYLHDSWLDYLYWDTELEP